MVLPLQRSCLFSGAAFALREMERGNMPPSEARSASEQAAEGRPGAPSLALLQEQSGGTGVPTPSAPPPAQGIHTYVHPE